MHDPLKVLVLGNVPVGEIAVHFAVSEEVVLGVERLFFDARACRSATDWVLQFVIAPEESRGKTALASHLRSATTGLATAVSVLTAIAWSPLCSALASFEK